MLTMTMTVKLRETVVREITATQTVVHNMMVHAILELANKKVGSIKD